MVDDGLDIPWLERASRRAKWLVGVSGGADSVALLHLLVDAGFRRLVVCHLDHRLRGRESTADARFVAKLAGRFGCACEVVRDDVRRRMERDSISLETAARQARHEFFACCAAKHRCPRVLLAHHAEDQAETVLWNLLRGSHGLRGMEECQTLAVGKRKLTLVRPLLRVRRADLVSFLTRRGLRWREDASNAEPIAIRNRLRREGIPLLAEITGRDPVRALVRLAEDDAELRLETRSLLDAARWLDPQGRIHLPALRGLTPRLQRAAVHRFLSQHGVSDLSRNLLDEILAMLVPGGPPAVNLPGGSRLRRGGGRLWIDAGA